MIRLLFLLLSFYISSQTNQNSKEHNLVLEIPNIENKLNTDERKRGWGLQLITELMDTVEYDSDETGTTVTMTKKREDNE